MSSPHHPAARLAAVTTEIAHIAIPVVARDPRVAEIAERHGVPLHNALFPMRSLLGFRSLTGPEAHLVFRYREPAVVDGWLAQLHGGGLLWTSGEGDARRFWPTERTGSYLDAVEALLAEVVAQVLPDEDANARVLAAVTAATRTALQQPPTPARAAFDLFASQPVDDAAPAAVRLVQRCEAMRHLRAGAHAAALVGEGFPLALAASVEPLWRAAASGAPAPQVTDEDAAALLAAGLVRDDAADGVVLADGVRERRDHVEVATDRIHVELLGGGHGMVEELVAAMEPLLGRPAT